MSQLGADTFVFFTFGTVVLRDLQVFNQCRPDPKVKLDIGQRMLSCLYPSKLVVVILAQVDSGVITVASGVGCSKAAW